MSNTLEHYVTLLTQVQARLIKAQPLIPELLEGDILHQLAEVIEQLQQHTGAGYDLAQTWLVRLFTHLPQLAPVVERELLWFFGGDCLHFLSDEEIQAFQQADD